MDEVIKKVKKKSKINGIIIGILSIILGMILGPLLCINVIKYYTVEGSIFDHTADELDKGQWYACDSNMILDYYASDDDGYYYIMPIDTKDGNGTFMGLYVSEKDYDLANSIADQTYSYLMGQGGEPQDHIVGVGQIHEMKYDERKCFMDYLVESGMEYSNIGKLSYYTLELTTKSNLWGFVEILGIGLLLFFVGLGIFIIFKYLSGGNMKKFNEVMSQNNISTESIESDISMGTHIGKFYIGRKYIVSSEIMPKLIILDQLVWVYPHLQKTKHTVNHVITVGTTKSYSVILVDKFRTTYQIPVRKEAQGQQVIDEISRVAPYIIAGYSDEIANLYATDFTGMCQYVADKKLN